MARKKSQMLSIFMMKEEVESASKFIKDDGNLNKIVMKINKLETCLYFKQNEPNVPSWVNIFKPYIIHNLDKINKLENKSTSAVLVIKIKERFFALAFGYGRLLLNLEYCEDKFGLRTVLNEINPNEIKVIDAKTFEETSMKRRTQANSHTNFSNFGLDIGQDIMYAASGTPKTKSLCSSFSGKDSLSITLPFELKELPSLLKRLISSFEKKTYKNNFPWVDNVLEVSTKAKIDELNAILISKLNCKNTEGIYLVVPGIIEWENVLGFAYRTIKKDNLFTDVNIEDFIKELDKDISIDELKKQNIYCLSNLSDGINHYWPIYKTLYCEIKEKNTTFLLDNGRWFEINNNFIENLDNYLTNIPPSNIKFPEYNKFNKPEYKESDYNKEVANMFSESFYLMDAQNVSHGGGHSKIEFCDIYSINKQLIHVKRYRRSSEISHLFSQAIVSFELMMTDAEFRKKVNRILPKKFKLKNKEHLVASSFEVVYVIIREDGCGTILDLPLFSKINLRSAYHKLLSLGAKVSIHIVPNGNVKN